MHVFGQDRYRTVDEARTIETLLMHGWRYEVAAGGREDAARRARAALDGLVALGLPFRRAPSGGRLFDPAEAYNALKWAASRGDTTWEAHCMAAGRREAWEDFPGEADLNRPPDLSTLKPRRLSVTVRRTFNLTGRRPGERVRLRLPAPLDEPAHPSPSVEILPMDQPALETVIAPGRIDVVLAVPEGGEASIGMRARFVVGAPAPRKVAPLDPAEAALYTRPAEGLIKVSERVSALAAEIAGGDTEPAAIVRRIWDHLMDALSIGPMPHDQLDPRAPLDWVIAHGWCDCQAGSALLAALCRARGVPARLVTGYMLHRLTPALHSWTEIWTPDRGWAPFDLAGWELAAGGRDMAWRDVYYGKLDHRMVVERPPRLFAGLGAVRLPRAWRVLTTLTDQGTAASFEDVDTGASIYREEISLEPPD